MVLFKEGLIIKCTNKKSINSFFHFMHAPNVKGSPLNIVAKDAFSKIGSRLISLNAQVRCLKQGILFY